MIIIAALTHDHIIGSGDTMPWSIPEEYAHFLDCISGQTVIMGRISYEIFGDSLTSAHTIILSRSPQNLEKVVQAYSIDSAIEIAKSYGKEIYVAGGAEIYAQFLPLVDRMYLSYIKGKYKGDSYFPKINSGWKIFKKEDRGTYEFVEYVRK